MTVAVCPVRPDSRGTIMARSPDASEKPIITTNYLSDPADIRVLTTGVRFTRAIFASPAIVQHSVVETLPGPDITTDDGILDYARRYGTTIYHPVGTCRMGDGSSAVVDSRLRVHGDVVCRQVPDERHVSVRREEFGIGGINDDDPHGGVSGKFSAHRRQVRD